MQGLQWDHEGSRLWDVCAYLRYMRVTQFLDVIKSLRNNSALAVGLERLSYFLCRFSASLGPWFYGLVFSAEIW